MLFETLSAGQVSEVPAAVACSDFVLRAEHMQSVSLCLSLHAARKLNCVGWRVERTIYVLQPHGNSL